MSKIKPWTLIGIAILFLVITSLLPAIFLVFGVPFIAIGLYMGFKPEGISKKEKILESREAPMEIDQDKSKEAFKIPDNPIKQSKTLAIEIKKEEKKPEVIASLKEEEKPAVIVVPKEERKPVAIAIPREEEKTESLGRKINKTQDWGNTMPRKDLFLIVLGILFLIISFLLSGVSSIFTIFSYLGILSIGAGLYLLLKNMLRKEQVLDSWGMLIRNGQGKFSKVFEDTESFIKESKAPSLEIRKDKMAPGLIGSIFGGKRDFLVVKDKQSSMLNPYQIFINARDYGNNLDVSWYLTYRPSFFEAFLAMFRIRSSIALTELDLFELQDLTAYTAVCHHSTLDAVVKLMLELNQDPSRIDRKSKGFLGIS